MKKTRFQVAMNHMILKVARYTDQALSRAHRRLARYMDGQAGLSRQGHLTIGQAYDSGWKGYACVFALSTGRTGTQTLAALLGCSSAVVAEHEPAPRLVKTSFDAFMDTNRDNWLARWIPAVWAARDDHVLFANKEGRVYVETNNRMTYLARALREAFPESRFIFSHRHPYEVIKSGMRRGAYQGPDMAWNFARIRPRPGEPYDDVWSELSPLEKEAWRWARINADIMEFMGELPETRYLELSARDLFSEHAAMYARLFAFVGVACPPMSVLEQVRGRRMNAQDHFDGLNFSWTEEKKALVRPIIDDVARRLGYEL